MIGIDMSSEAIAFCSRAHAKHGIDFKVGDALNLPLADESCDAVINVESSHSYGNLPKFLNEVRRICRSGAWFLHTDFLSPEDWDYVRMRIKALGFVTETDRDITANVLASRDQASNNWEQVYGDGNARVANFLALPGSAVYEQLRAGLLEYRILRSQLRTAAPSDRSRHGGAYDPTPPAATALSVMAALRVEAHGAPMPLTPGGSLDQVDAAGSRDVFPRAR